MGFIIRTLIVLVGLLYLYYNYIFVSPIQFSDLEPSIDFIQEAKAGLKGDGFTQDWRGKITKQSKFEIESSKSGKKIIFTESDSGDSKNTIWVLNKINKNQYKVKLSNSEKEYVAEQYGNVFHISYEENFKIFGYSMNLSISRWFYLLDNQQILMISNQNFYGIPLGSTKAVLKS